MSALGHLYLLVSYIYQGDIFILNHLGLEHLSGVKGGCPIEEAYYLKLSLFKALSTFSEVFLCYIDVWFLTYGIRAQGLGVSLLHLIHRGIFAVTFFLQCFKRNHVEGI
jgi:hypothetical protein